MKKLSKLSKDILLLIQNEDEHFESLYFALNDIPYINRDGEGNSLYHSLSELPQATKYDAKDIFENTKELIKKRYVCCLISIKKNNQGFLKIIKRPNLISSDVFFSYWLRITLKGKTAIEI